MLAWKISQDFSLENVDILALITDSQKKKTTPVSTTFFHPSNPSFGSSQTETLFENGDTKVDSAAL